MAYSSLHERLNGPVQEALKKELGIKNIHALPRVEKVVVNLGINKSKTHSKEMEKYIDESLQKITGQKPVFTKARKAISNFKIREGNTVGASVTLRGPRMEEFLDRLLSYALPRVRDFRGLKTKLDGHGNYAIGLKDHSIFPEVPPPDAKEIFGLQIQITTTAENDEQGRALLKNIGMPFRPEKTDEGGEKGQESEKGQKGAASSAKTEVSAEAEDKKKDEPVASEADSEENTAAEAPTDEAPAEETPDAKKETPDSSDTTS